MQRDKGFSSVERNPHRRQPLVTLSSVSQDTNSVWCFMFATRGRVSLSVLLRPVHTLPSKSGPVFSSYPDMQPVPRVRTKNRASLSSLDTWPEPSVWSQSDPGGTFIEASPHLPDRVTTCMLYLVTFSPLLLFFYTFVQILSLFLSSSTRSSTAPEGFHLHSACPGSCTFATTCTGLWSQIRGVCVMGRVGV